MMNTNCLLSFIVINKVNKAVAGGTASVRPCKTKKTLRGPAATVKNYFIDSTS